MPHGGRRKGAGRKRALPLTRREEIRHEYRQRMGAWAAARLFGRDQNIQKRRALDANMRKLAAKFKVADTDQDDGGIRYLAGSLRSEMQKLQAEIDRLPNQPSGAMRRPRGRRNRIIKELAEEYGISKRMVVRCIYET
jgi:hypothetical protein